MGCGSAGWGPRAVLKDSSTCGCLTVSRAAGPGLLPLLVGMGFRYIPPERTPLCQPRPRSLQATSSPPHYPCPWLRPAPVRRYGDQATRCFLSALGLTRALPPPGLIGCGSEQRLLSHSPPPSPKPRAADRWLAVAQTLRPPTSSHHTQKLQPVVTWVLQAYQLVRRPQGASLER